MDLPKTRKEAKALGIKRFYTGIPCKHGHVAPRQASDNKCTECGRLKHYKPENKIKYKRWRKEYRSDMENLHKVMILTLRKVFGITFDEYMQMLKIQDFKCKICAKPFEQYLMAPGKKRDACVDHCHTTNKIRGLLCDDCNRGIGNLKDNPNHLANAINYLVSTV